MIGLLVGNPNSGKTTLFNALTGLSARVGNYPGITVEHREGVVDLGAHKLTLVDLPGTYSLAPRSDDEVVAVKGLLGRLTQPADVIVVVVDATALERNLYLLAQLRELPLPIVVALTMMDTIAKDGIALDVTLLEKRLGVPVIPAPAITHGANALKAKLAAIADDLRAGKRHRPLALNPPAFKLGDSDDVTRAGAMVARTFSQAGLDLRGCDKALGLLAAQLIAIGALDKLDVPRVTVDDAHKIAEAAVKARYVRVKKWLDGVVAAPDRVAPSVRFTNRVDAIALHPVLGPLLLVGVFVVLFQTLFSWAQPVMDAITDGMKAFGALVGAHIPDSMPLVKSLVENGVIKGVGNVVVFVPQIAALFLFLTLLEDSGYLARAAFILDRVMAKVGLHGRAFVPMLSGYACAVPAILATRTIESNKDRIVTILVTPLISCSARLPVYSLVIACVFSNNAMRPLFGFVAPGAAVMIAMYALSLTAAIGMAAIFKRTLLKSPTPPLVLELPPYRVPKAGAVVRAVASRVKIFLTEAGTVILAITVVLWALFTFPRDDSIDDARKGAVAAVMATTSEGPARDAELQKVEAKAAKMQVEQSIAGRAGHALEPVLSPLGFDWKLNVGIIASFAAREVLVSTLGLVYGLGEGNDENSPSLREAMRADVRADGSPVYTPLVGLSLLVFFVLAMQCMSTLATVRRETRSLKWPAFQFAYMSALAYVGSLIVYQGGRLLGFGG